MKTMNCDLVMDRHQIIRWFCTVLIFLPVCSWGASWADVAKIDWYTGHEANSRYVITSPEQFAGLAKLVTEGNDFTGKTIVLDNDLDLSGKEWMAIGIQGENSIPFNGNFDAQNHTIEGLTISEGWIIALFGVLNENGSISNLNLSGKISSNNSAAGLVAINLGKIYNCCCNVDIKLTENHATGGGIVTMNLGIISNSCNKGNIQALSGTAGGIAGISDADPQFKLNPLIVNCYNSGNISGSAYYMGGIVGTANAGGPSAKSEITNCYNIGQVTNNKNPADQGYNSTGGICGNFTAHLSNCYNAGNVTGKQGETGALVGINYGNIINSYYLSGNLDGIGKGNNIIGSKALNDNEMKSLPGKAGALVDLLNVTAGEWNIDANKNKGYPFLVSVPTDPSIPIDPPTSNTKVSEEDNVSVFTEAGNIYIQTLKPAKIDVYTIDGHKVSGTRIQSGKQNIGNYHSGIYIIQIEGKQAKKIYIQ